MAPLITNTTLILLLQVVNDNFDVYVVGRKTGFHGHSTVRAENEADGLVQSTDAILVQQYHLSRIILSGQMHFKTDNLFRIHGIISIYQVYQRC